VSLAIAVGDPMPSIGLRATDGYLLNLRSFVTKQPAAFLFFGAPTLEGAARRKGIKAAEALKAGHRRLTAAGIAVVGVSCDNEEQQIQFAAEAKLPYLLFSDERRIAVELLGIPTVAKGANVNVAQPMVIGVDRDGFVRAVIERVDPDWVVEHILRPLGPPAPEVIEAAPSSA
jgi:peroxiredoxin